MPRSRYAKSDNGDGKIVLMMKYARIVDGGMEKLQEMRFPGWTRGIGYLGLDQLSVGGFAALRRGRVIVGGDDGWALLSVE